jgi:hypothetical protein
MRLSPSPHTEAELHVAFSDRKVNLEAPSLHGEMPRTEPTLVFIQTMSALQNRYHTE